MIARTTTSHAPDAAHQHGSHAGGVKARKGQPSAFADQLAALRSDMADPQQAAIESCDRLSAQSDLGNCAGDPSKRSAERGEDSADVKARNQRKSQARTIDQTDFAAAPMAPAPRPVELRHADPDAVAAANANLLTAATADQLSAVPASSTSTAPAATAAPLTVAALATPVTAASAPAAPAAVTAPTAPAAAEQAAGSPATTAMSTATLPNAAEQVVAARTKLQDRSETAATNPNRSPSGGHSGAANSIKDESPALMNAGANALETDVKSPGRGDTPGAQNDEKTLATQREPNRAPTEPSHRRNPSTDVSAPMQAEHNAAIAAPMHAATAIHAPAAPAPAPAAEPAAAAAAVALRAERYVGDAELDLRAPDFGHRFAIKVEQLTLQGIDRAELKISPAELGPIELSIKLTDLGAQIEVHAAHTETLQAIEQSLPSLRHLLADQGVQVDTIELSGGSTTGGNNGSNATDSHGRGFDQSNHPSGSRFGQPEPAGPSDSDRPSVARRGLLDLFA